MNNMEENSIAKKCEICGEIKPIDAFSKSYKNRCKDCVAKMTRLARKEEAIKQMEVINDNLERAVDEYWRQVRVKAAISAMQAMYSNREFDNLSFERIAQKAANQADALIEELKKEK